MTSVVEIAVALSIGVVVLASVLATIRVALGPDDASRAVVGDLLFFCAVAIFLLGGLLRETSVLFDVLVVAMLCGLLATVALARILTGGRR